MLHDSIISLIQCISQSQQETNLMRVTILSLLDSISYHSVEVPLNAHINNIHSFKVKGKILTCRCTKGALDKSYCSVYDTKYIQLTLIQ